MESTMSLDTLARELSEAPAEIKVPTGFYTDPRDGRQPIPSHIRVLRDDEVVDHGGYVIPKDPNVVAGYIVLHCLLDEFARIHASVVHGPTSYKVLCHTSKPVLMRGMYYETENRYLAPLVVEGRTVQGIARRRDSWVMHGDGDYTVMGRTERLAVHSIATLRTAVRALVGSASPAQRDIIDRLLDPDRMTPGVWSWHGEYDRIDWATVSDARRNLAQFGRCVGKLVRAGGYPDSYILDEAISLLQFEYDRNGDGMLLRRMLGAWNDSAAYENQIAISGCGHVCRADDNIDVHDGTACQECVDEYYVEPEDSSQLYRRTSLYEGDDGEYYVNDPDGDGDDDGGAILDYSTNPLRVLKSDRAIRSSSYGDFTLGIELEVSADGCHHSAGRVASEVRDDLDRSYVICKHDGSLRDEDFEIVTAPRGMAEHVRRFKEWEPPTGMTAWDTGYCGMHVHIDSHAFTPVTLGKFIEFINSTANDQMVNRIAGRHPHWDEQSREYCAREGMVHPGNPKKTLAGKSPTRYRMVNATNLDSGEARRLGLPGHNLAREFNTIELRIFRASLNKRRLLAQIEFAHAAVMFCRTASMRDLGNKAFLKWLRGFAGVYPHLAKWYGVRANTDAVKVSEDIAACAEI